MALLVGFASTVLAASETAAADLGVPFDGRHTTDRLGRSIASYLSNRQTIPLRGRSRCISRARGPGRSTARVYLASGTEDRATPPVATDVMAAELVRLGRDETYDRRLGEDHGFAGPGHGVGAGFEELFRQIAAWWIGPG